jgi:hypothetical protein
MKRKARKWNLIDKRGILTGTISVLLASAILAMLAYIAKHAHFIIYWK